MYIVDRSVRFAESFLKAYGPTNIKRFFWNKEYSGNKWDFADNTIGDCVYSYLERYSTNGSILDIGCGSGNTATEMPMGSYLTYLGIDISEAALIKARRRSKECGRQDKNQFACADFLEYVPTGQFDVILFRESMYHVPLSKIKATLECYAKHLSEGGVFIVRLFASSRNDSQSKDKYRPTAMFGIIGSEFDVLEKCQFADPGRPTVIVFRPK